MRFTNSLQLSNPLTSPPVEVKTPQLVNTPSAPAPFFLKRLDEINRLVQSIRSNHLEIFPPITGPIGSGKRSLVLQFIQDYSNHYDFIFWLSPSGKQGYANSYQKIAAALNIDTRATDLSALIQHVQDHLSNSHCLYIFSHAISFITLQRYLPRQGHVMAISPNSKPTAWSRSPFHISPLSNEEIMQFIRHYSQNDTSLINSFSPFLSLIPPYPLAIIYTLRLLKQDHMTLDHLMNTIKAKPTLFWTLFKDAENRSSYYQFIRHLLDLFSKVSTQKGELK